MSNTNMINPANYYNPFAKYNYVSKTRGIYIPKNTEPLLKTSYDTEKSSSIYSDNYDAETDVLNSMANEDIKSNKTGLMGIINKYFSSSDN